MNEPDATQAFGEILIAVGVVIYAEAVITTIPHGTFVGVIIAAAGVLTLAYRKYYRNNRNSL